MRIEFPQELPISARAEEITTALRDHAVVIVAGETGSGKTTQVPKMCLAAGRGILGRIACTQPRRIAALSLSRRLAEEMGVPWGREVGCKVRFADNTSRETVVKFLTDGMLLAEAQGDPNLREYDTIVVDEAHERSLNIDLLLGHLRRLLALRPELKVVITSATIDTDAFSRAFGGAPVISVSGRLFPVEVIHAPLDAMGTDADEDDASQARAEGLHYVDGAVEHAVRIAREEPPGDILIFMPSERDIRETCDLLEGRLRDCETVALFGRLSAEEQQRIFAPARRRRIVVATNIAETSLTLPGIRYVVDTGLARVSRYAVQSRTRRLPIEPISRSSADQRKGRCGRVRDGVCVRLYSEKDYEERPRFTQPEIQRANLADVILRLKAHGMGEVETFPFIDPPSPKAVRAGYLLLEELGALVAAGSLWELTDLGRELARLPVDPTVGRMLLQARTERAQREVLVIASGLSIQDPRERPTERRAQADAAHRRFAHPDSDFLTLLAIWEAFHGEVERMTQGRLRTYCRDHHLSYLRMREWRDLHAQLEEALGFGGGRREAGRPTSVHDGLEASAGRSGAIRGRDPMAFGGAGYRAIHRSILSGLLGGIACLDEENGGYKAAHDRKVVLFPGSVLHERAKAAGRPPGRGEGAQGSPAGAGERRAPRWIVASEIVETSRLFARTCARLDPSWLLDLGAHLLRVSHSEPFWNPEAGRVLVRQRTRLYGLEIDSRPVGYGRIDPAAATDIFIREGLVNDTLLRPLDFVERNRQVRERVQTLLTRNRDPGYLNLDELVRRFYADRLENVSSVAELAALVRERRAEEPDFLVMDVDDLRDPQTLRDDDEAFPEALPLVNGVLPIAYAYRPGNEDDGVTVTLSVAEVGDLGTVALDWAVPGHVPAKVEHLLRALPKELRRAFFPLAESAARLAQAVIARDRLTGRRQTVAQALASEIAERHNLRVDPAHWEARPYPDHLRVRLRVIDAGGQELASGRELSAVCAGIEAHGRAASSAVPRDNPEAWRGARARWESPERRDWGFGDIPAEVPVAEVAGVAVRAYPALTAGEKGVAVRLFRSPEEAGAATHRGAAALMAEALRNDLAWLDRDLQGFRVLGPSAATLAPIEALRQDAFVCLRAWLTERPLRASPEQPLTAEAFAAAVEGSRADLRGLALRVTDLVAEIVALRQDLLVEPRAPAGLQDDLAALLPADFLRLTPYPLWARLPVYLRGLKVRCERARRDPIRDADRVRQMAPYAKAAASAGRSSRLFWLVEEFRLSLFAQELGTTEPVSAVKLDRLIRSGEGGAPVEAKWVAPAAPASSSPAQRQAAGRSEAPGPPAPAPAPPTAPALPLQPPIQSPASAGGTKPAPLKSLSALGRIFPPRPS